MENNYSMKRTYLLLLALNLLPINSVAHATNGIDSSYSKIAEDALGDKLPEHYLRFTIENDVYFAEDKDYTNGVRIDYAQSIDEDSFWGLSLTQNIYTPYTNASYTLEGEHPYAGYLALGAAYITVGESIGTSTEFQIGTTGNQSLARETQRFIHGVTDLFQWRGWDTQVPAEVTFQLSSRQDFNIACLELDATNELQSDSMLYAREELGTFAVRAGVGYVFRLGYNLPPSLRQIGNRSANFGVSSLEKMNYDVSKSSYFFVVSILGEYVEHDLSIDGGVFRDFKSTAESEPWQAEAQLGAALVYKGVSYYIGATYNTKRYPTQFTNNFQGVLSLTFSW